MPDRADGVSRETAALVFRGARLCRTGSVGPIDLEFQPGENVAILGPNGAGKSSLLRMAAGAVAPDSGACAWGDVPLSRSHGSRRRGRIAHLPQRTPSAPGYTPYEQAVIGADSEQALLDALAVAGLAPLAHRRLGTLSGGERRRAALAAALAQRSELLILDEPFSGIDPGMGDALAAELARRARAGTLVLTALHDPELALRHATRLVLLADGRVVDDMPARAPDAAPRLRAVYANATTP
ncbi:MAG: ATP-binding cassette domain-containing protein [Armatimonadota bacterium]